MRKPKTYYATRGALTGEGRSKTEAKADLEQQIDWACNHAAGVAEWRFGLLLIVFGIAEWMAAPGHRSQ